MQHALQPPPAKRPKLAPGARGGSSESSSVSSAHDGRPPTAPPQLFHGIVVGAASLVAAPRLRELVRARGGDLFEVRTSKLPPQGLKATHVLCDDDTCAPRADALRAAAGAPPTAPLVRREWLTESIRCRALQDIEPFLIAPPAPPAPPPPATPVVSRRGAGDGAADTCASCGGALPWSAIERCMRCMESAPAALRALHLRYRADHPHNRALVAAFEELYEYEVTAAAGAATRLNAAEAFSRAAAVLKAAPAPLRCEEDLLDACLPYIGDKTRRLVAEFLATGAMTRLEQHRSNARTSAALLFARIPWVGASAATRWAAAGARTYDDLRAADAAGTLEPPLPASPRSLQRLAVQHAEELSVPVPREQWAPIRAVCEQVIAAADPTAEWHIAGGYGRGRPAPYDLDYLVCPREEGAEVELHGKICAALDAHPDVEWCALQQHSAPEAGALAALRTEAHRARKRDTAGQSGESAGGVVAHIDMHSKLFLLLQVRGQPARRVDFILPARSQWAFCVLGWAGSRRFERFLRLWASEVREPPLRLNSHCAFHRAGGVTTTLATRSGRAVPLDAAQADYIDARDWPRDERDLFERILRLPYRPPTDRDA